MTLSSSLRTSPQPFDNKGPSTDVCTSEWRCVDTNRFVGDIAGFARSHKLILDVGRTLPARGKFVVTYNNEARLPIAPLPLPQVVSTLRKTPDYTFVQLPIHGGELNLEMRHIEAELKLLAGARNEAHFQQLLSTVQENYHFVLFTSDNGRKRSPQDVLPPSGDDFIDLLNRCKAREDA